MHRPLAAVLVASAAVLAAGALAIGFHTSSPAPSETLFLDDAFRDRLKTALDLVDYTPANVTTSNLGIHLTAGCRRLTLAALPAQTQSVANGLAGKIDVRPNAHDLMREVLQAFNITLVQARVERLSGDAYYGRLNLQQGGTILSLDARPSDAIAIAVRLNGTVHVNKTLMEKSGEGIC